MSHIRLVNVTLNFNNDLDIDAEVNNTIDFSYYEGDFNMSSTQSQYSMDFDSMEEEDKMSVLELNHLFKEIIDKYTHE